VSRNNSRAFVFEKTVWERTMRQYLVGILTVLIFCLGLSACGRKASAPTHGGDAKRYEFKGKVVEVDKEKKTPQSQSRRGQRVMAAMTMCFR